MKSNLESYIEKNRGKLDTGMPDDELAWQVISSRLDARKKQQGWLWKAAAILLIFLSVGSVSIYSVNRTLHNRPAGISLSDISEELGQEEIMFRQEVFRKMGEVRPEM